MGRLGSVEEVATAVNTISCWHSPCQIGF